MGMKRIHLTIDRLALTGFDPAERSALIEGLRNELAHILAHPATRVALKHSRRTPILRLGSLSAEPGPTGSRKFGGSIARAIGRSMKP
jgi:hypothetical protein